MIRTERKDQIKINASNHLKISKPKTSKINYHRG